GAYAVQLEVTDNKGATGSTALTISVQGSAINQPPVARAAADIRTGFAPLAVAFTGSGSSDPEGSALSFAWTFGDGSSSALANPSKIYAAAGTYTVTLTVTDSKGASATTSLSIVVQSKTTNAPPVARASASTTVGAAPLAIGFSSTGSSDPEGTALRFDWAF